MKNRNTQELKRYDTKPWDGSYESLDIRESGELPQIRYGNVNGQPRPGRINQAYRNYEVLDITPDGPSPK